MTNEFYREFHKLQVYHPDQFDYLLREINNYKCIICDQVADLFPTTEKCAYCFRIICDNCKGPKFRRCQYCGFPFCVSCERELKDEYQFTNDNGDLIYNKKCCWRCSKGKDRYNS